MSCGPISFILHSLLLCNTKAIEIDFWPRALCKLVDGLVHMVVDMAVRPIQCSRVSISNG